MPNFKKFGEVFVILEEVRSATGTMLLMGAPICKKVYIFGINMKNCACSEMAENF